jgi:energy-coupling factor transporter ATP-binding protein EcfA2
VSDNRNWPGAKWWKFDFHTHTPASDDYGKGQHQEQIKQISATDWLLGYMRAGIDCLVVTDHNTGAWVNNLQSALDELKALNHPEFKPVYLFPGVEISVHGGIHIIAVFNPNKSTSDIDTLLGAVGYQGIKGKMEECTQKSALEVIAEISRNGGLAIPAHVDKPNGLFTVFSGTMLQQILDCEQVVAIELMDAAFQKPQLYTDKKLRWTEVLGSDSHHPTGLNSPGSHFTWVKMHEPNLDGLRLALLDGPLSIKRSDSFTGNPNSHGHLLIEELSVETARYIGRAQPFECRFNPWLNTIIGGRGTGKSTLLEFLRSVLRREKEIPESLKREFDKYQAVAEARQDEGLLTDASVLKATYRKEDTLFRVQWSVDGSVRPILERREDGTWISAPGDIVQRFPVRIYSQKQIFELARQPRALLKIIDDAPEVNYREWLEKWDAEETKLLALRAKLREIDAGLKEEHRFRGELEDVKRKLMIFEKTGHAGILKRYQRRMRQRRAIESWEESWIKTGDQIRDFAEQITPETLDLGLFNLKDESDKLLIANIENLSKQLEQISTCLKQVAGQADQVVTAWQHTKSESQWHSEINQAVETYDKLQKQLRTEQIGDPSSYGKLVQDRQSLEERLKNIQSRRKSLEDIAAQANNSLERLKKLRVELTKRRSAFLNDVLAKNPFVSIKIMPYGSSETVEEEFRNLINRSGSGFEKDIGSPGEEGILGALYNEYPENHIKDESVFNNKIQKFESRLSIVKNLIKSIAKGGNSNSIIKDKRFVTFINNLPPENLDRLDSWFPEDSLDIRYSTSSGGEFRPVQQGSPGQKTAALLAFLLSYGNEPLILDQPEDDLDNHLIYDLIVTQLREIKQQRQIIVVTHNANIVVNGDSELVIALDVRRGQTQKVCEGSLQESIVRGEVCKIMEGGEEAFEQRYRRIRAGGPYV